MKSTIFKTTVREIRESLGRYMAILAIVALGVGFFTGLKVTKPAMLRPEGNTWRRIICMTCVCCPRWGLMKAM